MTYFVRNGNCFSVSESLPVDLQQRLPAGNYIIKQDMFKNFYLEMVDSFARPAKLYGNTTRHTDRIMHTFLHRNATTGVLLAGEKGSGKTLLAKNVSMVCAEQDIPCIIINTPWSGDGFNKLLQDIEQPCMLLFDEFEKVYADDDQEAILTLLDGVFTSKKLFVFTVNDKWRVNQHMRNRPGRIFYMLEFAGLDYNFITEYCQDNLVNKDHIDQVCKISSIFGEFNFDMLKALVEEMNRYNESPQEAIKMLNAKPEYSDANTYGVALENKGVEVPRENVDDDTWTGNPLTKDICIDYHIRVEGEDGEDDDIDYQSQTFRGSDLKTIDARNGRFIFINGDGAKLTLDKVKERKVSYYDF